MTYATRAMAKDRLGIPLSDASEDTSIDANLASGDIEVNIVLGRYTTVPLVGTVPDEIKDIAADFACARRREDLNPKDEQAVFWRTRAEKNLAGYIATNYGPGPYSKATAYAIIEET